MKSERGSGAESEIVPKVRELIAEQPQSWPLLAAGLQGLRNRRERTVHAGPYEVAVRHIPHRIRSTTASIDPADVAKRACFLCTANRPTEQRGVPLSAEYSGYCNPFPIVEGHLTLIHNDHRWQTIAGEIGALLDFAAILSGWLVIYNGAECGASAPDHLHFQALPREEQGKAVFPLERTVRENGGRSISDEVRRIFVAQDTDRLRLIDRVEQLMSILMALTGKQPEPMVNIAVFANPPGWTVCVFPRSRHRPSVFERGELTVSPASVDLAGVFVVPQPADFDRITGGHIASIFDEITLSKDLFDAALRQWESRSS